MLAQVIPINLDPGILLKLGEYLVFLISAWAVLNTKVGQLVKGQTETLRQLAALHKRLDEHAKEIRLLDKKTAVIWDRLNRSTQRVVPVADNPFADGWTDQETTP